jgi:hypothetical protein
MNTNNIFPTLDKKAKKTLLIAVAAILLLKAMLIIGLIIYFI